MGQVCISVHGCVADTAVGVRGLAVNVRPLVLQEASVHLSSNQNHFTAARSLQQRLQWACCNALGPSQIDTSTSTFLPRSLQRILPEQRLLEDEEQAAAVLGYIPDEGLQQNIRRDWARGAGGMGEEEESSRRWGILCEHVEGEAAVGAQRAQQGALPAVAERQQVVCLLCAELFLAGAGLPAQQADRGQPEEAG